MMKYLGGQHHSHCIPGRTDDALNHFGNVNGYRALRRFQIAPKCLVNAKISM
jgi:hypothetical protein